MDARHCYLEDHALLFESLSGQFTISETLDLYDAFDRDPRIAGTRLKLADLRGINAIVPADKDLGNLLDLIAKQYLRRLDGFNGGVLLADAGPGLRIAREFYARLPTSIQPKFRLMSTVEEALTFLGLPQDTWSRLQTPYLTVV